MKGNNTMRLNEATLMEALQEYFDRRCVIGSGWGAIAGIRFDAIDGYFDVYVAEAVKDEAQKK